MNVLSLPGVNTETGGSEAAVEFCRNMDGLSLLGRKESQKHRSG